MYKRNEKPTFYVVTGYIDFRCGIDALCLKLKTINPTFNIMDNVAVVFMCKSKDKIKVLYWGGDGFWLIYIRLEESKYIWLQEQNDLIAITYKQLEWLLDGLSIIQKNYHNEVKRTLII